MDINFTSGVINEDTETRDDGVIVALCLGGTDKLRRLTSNGVSKCKCLSFRRRCTDKLRRIVSGVIDTSGVLDDDEINCKNKCLTCMCCIPRTRIVD